MGLAATLAGILRMFLAFIGTLFLLIGISLQFFSAGNLYNVRLPMLCTAHAGSDDLSDTGSFTVLINAALDKRYSCLSMTDEVKRQQCCAVYPGLCTNPSIKERSQFQDLTAGPKLALLTSIIGTFIGVKIPSAYDAANPEFWCKNCPNDWRKNCPFDPADTDASAAGMQVDKVCQCPGGKVSVPGEAFWSTISENSLSSRYIACSDKAEVYASWIKAIFPKRDTEVDHARSRFETKCNQNKGGTGYILVVGPALALIAGIFSLASLFKNVANTPVPVIGFNLGMIAIALTLVAFWATTFSGASGLISRYALCSGYQYPIVQNASFKATTDTRLRAAPVLYNEAPCFDLNSEGQTRNNPFIEQLAAFNGAYVSGGVLVIIALICMLLISSKVSDVVMEKKLAGDDANKKDSE